MCNARAHFVSKARNFTPHVRQLLFVRLLFLGLLDHTTTSEGWCRLGVPSISAA